MAGRACGAGRWWPAPILLSRERERFCFSRKAEAGVALADGLLAHPMGRWSDVGIAQGVMGDRARQPRGLDLLRISRGPAGSSFPTT